MEPLISVAACHGWHAALCLDELQSYPVTGQLVIVIKYGKIEIYPDYVVFFLLRGAFKITLTVFMRK